MSSDPDAPKGMRCGGRERPHWVELRRIRNSQAFTDGRVTNVVPTRFAELRRCAITVKAVSHRGITVRW